VCGRFKGFDWGITTRLVVIPHAVVTFDLVVIPQWLEVIPQWLVIIPQQEKFKAPQIKNVLTHKSISVKNSKAQWIALFVASKAEIQASYITIH